MKWRRRPFASLGEQLLCGLQSETPFDRATPEQAPAATLANEEPGERGRQAEDSAADESALAPDLALDPASRRSTAIDQREVLRDEPLVPAFDHLCPRVEAIKRQT